MAPEGSYVSCMDDNFVIRSVDLCESRVLQLVAARMGETLLEVVGRELYSESWLLDRLVSHLDGRLPGRVLVATSPGGEVVGHTVVRIEEGHGLFSTTYVDPAFRRKGVARKLLEAGEEWLYSQGARDFRTNTAPTNVKLQQLYQSMGYLMTPVNDDFVQLRKCS